MKKAIFFPELFILVILISSYACSNVTGQTNYYVSETGTGDTLNTIAEVNALNLGAGDSVFFKCGDTWRDELNIDEGGSSEAYVFYGSYGIGKRPEILGSELASGWEKLSGNIWWVYGFEDPCPGVNYNLEPIFELKSGEYVQGWGYLGSLNDVDEIYEWFWSNDTVYVYCESDPDSYFSSIEIPQRQKGIDIGNVDFVHIKNFRVANMQAFGIRDQYKPDDSFGNYGLIIDSCEVAYICQRESSVGYGIYTKFSDMIIRYNDVHDCGRRTYSYMVDDPIELSTSNILIEYNRFHDGYHGTATGIDHDFSGTVDNIVIRNNLFYEDISTDFRNDREQTRPVTGLWIQNNVRNSSSSRIQNIYFYNNIMYGNASYGVSFRGADTAYVCNNTWYGFNEFLPTDAWIPFVNIVNYSNEIYIYNNVWLNNTSRSTSNAQRWSMMIQDKDDNVMDSAIFIDYNIWYNTDPTVPTFQVAGNSYFMNYSGHDNITDYQNSTGFDTHSLFVDPLITLSDFSYIGKDSPLETMKGTKIMGGHDAFVPTTDFFGSPRDPSNITVGAVQYFEPDPSAAKILYFIFDEQTAPAEIDAEDRTVSVLVKENANVSDLTPEILVSRGATINPQSGVSQDFSDPVEYLVTSEDGSVKNTWVVTVTVAQYTGEPESKELAFKVFPNPTKDDVTVEFLEGQTELVRILLYSQSNVLLYSEWFTPVDNKITFPTNKLPDGAYTLQGVIGNNYSFYSNIIVLRE